MSMTADRSTTEAARRPHVLGQPQRTWQKKNMRPACAHPILFGTLATLSSVPLLLSAQHGVVGAILHPTAMTLGGWIGARCASRGGDANEAVARLVGTVLGTATASGAAHFFYSGGACEARAAWCVLHALANGRIGGLLRGPRGAFGCERLVGPVGTRGTGGWGAWRQR